jgi:hypothetical protein
MLEDNIFTDLPNVDRILQVIVFSNTELLLKRLLLHMTDVFLNVLSALLVQKSVMVLMVNNNVL